MEEAEEELTLEADADVLADAAEEAAEEAIEDDALPHPVSRQPVNRTAATEEQIIRFII